MTDCRRLRYTVLYWQKRRSRPALWDYAQKNGIEIQGLKKPKSDIGEEEVKEEVLKTAVNRMPAEETECETNQ